MEGSGVSYLLLFSATVVKTAKKNKRKDKKTMECCGGEVNPVTVNNTLTKGISCAVIGRVQPTQAITVLLISLDRVKAMPLIKATWQV